MPFVCTSSLLHQWFVSLVFQWCSRGLAYSIHNFLFFSLPLSEYSNSCTLSSSPDSLFYTWSSILVRLSNEFFYLKYFSVHFQNFNLIVFLISILLLNLSFIYCSLFYFSFRCLFMFPWYLFRCLFMSSLILFIDTIFWILCLILHCH
jgi:hypothetical protein